MDHGVEHNEEVEAGDLQSPPGMNVMTHHQILSIVAWWNTCRNVICVDFLRSTISTVSISSIAFEKKYHHSTFATCICV